MDNLNKEDNICRFVGMYAYLTLADMEEALLVQSIDQVMIEKVLDELESILVRHKQIVVNSLFDSVSFKLLNA